MSLEEAEGYTIEKHQNVYSLIKVIRCPMLKTLEYGNSDFFEVAKRLKEILDSKEKEK
jgi:hypothetical protein